MSRLSEKSPPIGAFVINPLSVNAEKQACSFGGKANESIANDVSTANEKREIGDDSYCLKTEEGFVRRTEIEKSCEGNRRVLDVKYTLNSGYDTFQDSGIVPSVPSDFQNDDSALVGKHTLSVINNSSTKSVGTSDKSSKLMTKLAVSGPPKFKFDQRKSVLPQSLLQGVTELVQKEQTYRKNDSVTSTNNSDRCKGSEFSSGTGVNDYFDNLKENANGIKSTNENEGLSQSFLGKCDTNDEVKVPCSNTIAFGCDMDASTSRDLEEKDAYTNLDILREADNDPTLIKTCEVHSACPEESAVAAEVNPFSEMDFSNLISDDFNPDISNSAETDKGTNVADLDEGFKMSSSDLLQIDTSIFGQKSVKPGDAVYNLSDLFSGELEQRRKKELRKQKKRAKYLERYSKKKKKKSDVGDSKGETEVGDQEEKPRKPVPNYFIAIQITDQKIKSGLKAVQDKVVSENKKLQPALNKLATLHLTMMMLSLKSVEDMERSRQALNRASEKLLSLYTDVVLELDVSGLGHFRNNVVFAKVKHEHQISTLKNIADVVEECFMEQEIISPDQKGFKPHITIMKLSSVKGSKKKGLKKIEEKLYCDFVDTDFGSEQINTLQLCAMMKPKDKQGYYQVEHKVQFAKQQDTDSTMRISSNSSGEFCGQLDEIKERFEPNIKEKAGSDNGSEIDVVENTEQVKDVDSKHSIMAVLDDDIVTEEDLDNEVETMTNETRFSVTNTTETQDNLVVETDERDVSANAGIKLDNVGMCGEKVCDVIELSKSGHELDTVDKGKKTETENLRENAEESKDNDSALDIGVETEEPKLKEVPESSTDNDSAIDIGVNIENLNETKA